MGSSECPVERAAPAELVPVCPERVDPVSVDLVAVLAVGPTSVVDELVVCPAAAADRSHIRVSELVRADSSGSPLVGVGPVQVPGVVALGAVWAGA